MPDDSKTSANLDSETTQSSDEPIAKPNIFVITIICLSITSSSIAGFFALEKRELNENIEQLTTQLEDSLNLLGESQSRNEQLLIQQLESEKRVQKYSLKQDEMSQFLKRHEVLNEELKSQTASLVKNLKTIESREHANQIKRKELATKVQDATKQLLVATKNLQLSQSRVQELIKQGKQLEEAANASKNQLLIAQDALQQAREESKLAVQSLANLEREHGINWKRRLGISKAPSVEGQILRVDQQTPPQIVINAGSNDRIEVDELFFILENGKPIGRARVKKVTATYCVASVLELKFGKAVRQGDQVTTVAPKTILKPSNTPE